MMEEIEFITEVPEEGAVILVACYKEDAYKVLPKLARHAIALKETDPSVEVFLPRGESCVRYVFATLGERESSTKASREICGSLLYKKASKGSEEIYALDCRSLTIEAQDLLTGLLLSSWTFDCHKSLIDQKKEANLKKILVITSNPKSLKEDFKSIYAMISGVFLARMLTSQPANIFYPLAYAEKIKELVKYGLEVEILEEDALRKIGMTALLAAGQGSDKAPCVAIIKWTPLKDESPAVVLVGKGVCFDSGGLCLKPSKYQQEMKFDKAGGGVVSGVMLSLAMANTKVNVIGIIGLVENMPDGKALKPGDVIKTMSKQTIEIADTDAEGRLVLADCLWYAENRFKPNTLIDLGTLTQETFATLGTAYAGLYSTSKSLAKSLINSGIQTGDLLWELPMGPYFAKQLESDCADMKNLGKEHWGENGASAEFLKKFVKTDSWAHIDIAGVSWTDEDLPLSKKGVTGFGVRLLLDFLRKLIPA